MTGRTALGMKQPLGKLPMNTIQLVALLKKCFPPLEVYPGMSPEEIMFASGAREVIRILSERLETEPIT